MDWFNVLMVLILTGWIVGLVLELRKPVNQRRLPFIKAPDNSIIYAYIGLHCFALLFVVVAM